MFVCLRQLAFLFCLLLFASLFDCLLACLHACLPACWLACIPIGLSLCPVCLPVCLPSIIMSMLEMKMYRGNLVRLFFHTCTYISLSLCLFAIVNAYLIFPGSDPDVHRVSLHIVLLRSSTTRRHPSAPVLPNLLYHGRGSWVVVIPGIVIEVP